MSDQYYRLGKVPAPSVAGPTCELPLSGDIAVDNRNKQTICHRQDVFALGGGLLSYCAAGNTSAHFVLHVVCMFDHGKL